MTFTAISDNDNIIDYNKWHFNRFLNGSSVWVDYNKWHFNRFLNASLSRLPAWSQRAISYKYQTPTPSTIPPLPPLSRHCTTAGLEKPTCWNHLGRSQASRSHCQFHNCQGLLPLDPTRSSPAPSANRLPVLPHLFTTAKKKLGKKMKKAFFYLCQSRVP